jgi:uncharacterized RDD family membrane protein YckC
MTEDPEPHEAPRTPTPDGRLPGESIPDGSGRPTTVQKHRIYAVVLDLILLLTPYALLLNVYHPYAGAALVVLYFTLTELIWGASLGKRAFHLRVVATRGDVAWWRIVARNLPRALWFLPFLFPSPFLLVDFVSVVALPRAQRWGDVLAGTTVAAVGGISSQPPR